MNFSTIYYRSFYLLAFLLFGATATAQGKLELKTEILGLAFDTRAEASLEYLLSERVGIEAGVGYDWDNSTSAGFDSSLMLINVDVERRELKHHRTQSGANGRDDNPMGNIKGSCKG